MHHDVADRRVALAVVGLEIDRQRGAGCEFGQRAPGDGAEEAAAAALPAAKSMLASS